MWKIVESCGIRIPHNRRKVLIAVDECVQACLESDKLISHARRKMTISEKSKKKKNHQEIPRKKIARIFYWDILQANETKAKPMMAGKEILNSRKDKNRFVFELVGDK